jgi:hypothetical protein
MLRLLQPAALAALAAGRCPASRATSPYSTASSSSALEWLEKFINYEQRGVPQAAGTDSDVGFDLVRGQSPAAAISCEQLPQLPPPQAASRQYTTSPRMNPPLKTPQMPSPTRCRAACGACWLT